MARILIADDPRGASYLQRLLGADHEILVVTTLRLAVDTLERQSFDLIIIGVQFDDSRMYDLMSECKKLPQYREKPIICFCTQDTPLTRTMHESIEVSTKVLGAWMYLDQRDYSVKKDPDAGLKRVIERCLIRKARQATQRQRQDIQKRRTELLELRMALNDAEWSADLEDDVADIREKLSHVLLELAEALVDSVEQNERLSQSKDLDGHVSQQVVQGEEKMASAERQQAREESRQLAKEQALVPSEEAKAKMGRREFKEKAGKRTQR